MSKRVQILIPEAEYREALSVSKRKKITMSELVRAGLRELTKKADQSSKASRLNNLLTLAINSGPTGEIEDILEEIHQGRKLNDLC